MSWREDWSCTTWVVFAIAVCVCPSANAQVGGGCDAATVAAKQAEFKRLTALKRFNPQAVSDATLRVASLDYVQTAEGCYASLTASRPAIDDGPLMPGDDGTQSGFQTSGAKWGLAPSYTPGVDLNGPRLPGGTVTYSFMSSGVSMGSHSDASLSISALNGYQPCLVSAIRNAFAAWSAVANIQFVEVPDNGVPFDAAGARGDIRIGAHSMDGQWGVLAHAFFPPPGGVSAAGDMHFDRHEVWACAPGPNVVDIGIVAAHEIGHAIGLNHETRVDRTALMNPYYNPATAPIVLADDVAGAAALYGVGIPQTDDMFVNFGQGFGLWELDYGMGWRLLHGLSPKQTVTGDLDGNGVPEQIVAFSNNVGIWIRWNNAWWSQLHVLTPAVMTTGDFDGNGRSDVVIDFAGYGLYVFYNGATWSRISTSDPSLMSVGNVDTAPQDDLVVTLPGQGVWVWANNAAWLRVHPNDADLITIGAMDGPTGPKDILLQIPGIGIYQLTNFTSWSFVTATPALQLTAGQLDGDTRGELVLDFGPTAGLWLLWNGTTWSWLHNLSSVGLTSGDLDGNGQDEVVIRFKNSPGLWMFVNGTSWVLAHGASPTDVTVSQLK